MLRVLFVGRAHEARSAVDGTPVKRRFDEDNRADETP
jgi:hypothetical protein